MAVLRRAVPEFSWLRERGYAERASLTLVGDRYQLRARQREAVLRASASEREIAARRRGRRSLSEIAGEGLWIDGFNLLTTVEAALGGGLLLHCRDGCLRDMVHRGGTWRRVEETHRALEELGAFLEASVVGPCRWLLDQPVSNSGRLAALLRDLAEGRGWSWEVELVPDPDPLLAEAPVPIVSADRAILDRLPRWVNLAWEVVQARIPRAWILDLAAVPR